MREYIVQEVGTLLGHAPIKPCGQYDNVPLAVEVKEVKDLIRCRECKHCSVCRDSGDSKDAITGFYCYELNDSFDENFYCAYGERREGG